MQTWGFQKRKMLTAFDPDWIKNNKEPGKYVIFKFRSHPKHREWLPVAGDIRRYVETYLAYYDKEKECFGFYQDGVNWDLARPSQTLFGQLGKNLLNFSKRNQQSL